MYETVNLCQTWVESLTYVRSESEYRFKAFIVPWHLIEPS